MRVVRNSFILVSTKAWGNADRDVRRLTCGLGKILKDEETVEAYKIEEKGFIVCMVQRVRDVNRYIWSISF